MRTPWGRTVSDSRLLSASDTRTSFGPYDVVRPLGSGGMCRVVLAKRRETGEMVAIKVLRPEHAGREALLARFQAEFRAARKIQHPHVVRALEFGEDDGLFYLVLEHVDGKSLAQILREKRFIASAKAVRWTRQIAAGLGDAHRNRVIHRDIKPGNILIDAKDDAKLADLGLAKDLAEVSQTQTGASLGTLLFLAPELYENARDANARSDIYSLGVTLYQALTGRFPFSGGNLAVLGKKLRNEFESPRQLAPDVHPALDDAIRQMLQADPAARPASCDAVIDLLDPVNFAALDEADPPSERRDGPRFPISLGTDCSLLTSSAEIWPGTIVDVSSGGLQIQVTRRFETGALLEIRPDGDTHRFIVRVQWVRPVADGVWSIGVKFHCRLPEAQLSAILEQATPHTIHVRET